MTEFIRKHRNALLLAALLITLTVSYLATQRRLTADVPTVALPVEQVTPAPSGALETFRAARESALLSDMAALQSLCEQEAVDPAIRDDAARQLQTLVERHEQQLALEGALSASGVYPCVAVINEGSVTVVTERSDLSDGESALILTLAQAHAGVAPQGVRVTTAGSAK